MPAGYRIYPLCILLQKEQNKTQKRIIALHFTILFRHQSSICRHYSKTGPLTI